MDFVSIGPVIPRNPFRPFTRKRTNTTRPGSPADDAPALRQTPDRPRRRRARGEGTLLKQLRLSAPRGQIGEHVSNREAGPTQARLPETDLRVNRDARQECHS